MKIIFLKKMLKSAISSSVRKMEKRNLFLEF
jgi:hypothetical protein